MVKFHLTQLPEKFEPTSEENALLQMYDTIKNFAREAARRKEQKAREKLEAKEVEFKRAMAKKRNVRRKKAVPGGSTGNDRGDEYTDDDDDVDDQGSATGNHHHEKDDDADDSASEMDENDRAQNLEERRAAKLEKLREEVETRQQAMMEAETREEAMRDQLLSTNEDVHLGPTLKRKRIQDNLEDGSSLLNSMMMARTPPHDFSKKLGFTPLKGKVVFPSPGLDNAPWKPPATPMDPNDGALLLELENFNVREASDGKGNNTLALKFSAPTDSKRFSFNIAGPGHDNFNSVLFHFNPRQFERGGQLVVNDKQDGVWGKAVNLPLSQVPLMFGQTSVTVQVQVNSDGFDIFIEDKHCARLEHRKELPSESCSLFLQFPSSDDYALPENWIVYKAWWGNKAIMAKQDVSMIPGVNSHNSVHPRKLFISGLPKIQSDADVDLRRAELERAFRKYGGAQGVTCIIPTNSTFAFVEMENERMADLAFSEMSSKYKINRARWSRHEALQEKRRQEEAAKEGNAEGASSAW